MILDRTSHVSASSYLSNVDKLEAITTVFPIFFFLVAALVSLTTMTRMVEEERLQIGTLKALGYKRGQIMFKYLFYAWVATLVGGAAGLAFGFTVIPIVIWNAYGTMYTIPGFRCLFHASLAVLGVGMLTAFLVSMLAIRFLMNYVKRHDFKVFGWYRIVLGAVVLVYFLLLKPMLG